VAEKDVQRLLAGLHHKYLPKLEEIGWIKRHPEGIVTTEHLLIRDTEQSFPLERQWDILAALLARPRRQHIVSILACKDQPLALEELVTELIEQERISWTGDEDDDDLSLAAILHHIDLPPLEEVGLIEYDCDEKTITPAHTPTTVVDWVDDFDVEEGTTNRSKY
jgi:hypothetical protein